MHAPNAPTTSATTISSIASKLPALTLAFWVMKIAATTLGETLGDFLSKGPEHGGIDLGYSTASLVVLGIFVVTVVPQLMVKRYIPPLYWLVILSTSTAGTTMSDFMDRTLGLGYANGSAILVGLLLTTLAVWRVVEGSISVNSVRSLRAEIFYWIAILCSNTLGTALGDYLADEEQGPGMGFMGSAVLIGATIAVIAAAYLVGRKLKVANVTFYVTLFWLAFILTRPFGATFGDVLARGHSEGGLGFGPGGSSLVLAGILVVMVAHATWQQRRALRAA
ncbi:MAG: hypothetical protein WC718_04795 [Phycisphaerales bacterium]|jgi:uncharacterized membrane-anchored protein